MKRLLVATLTLCQFPLIAQQFEQKLVPAGHSLQFGLDADVDALTAVVGAPHTMSQGAADVFVLEAGAWTQQVQLTAVDGQNSDQFGRAVTLSGDVVAVGAPRDDDQGGESGSCYIFFRGGTNWGLQQKVVASMGDAGDRFGYSVALEGDRLIVGAPRDDDGANDAGAVFVFEKVGGSWTERAKLIASDPVAGAEFGNDVALSGDTIIVGAYGAHPGGVGDAGAAYVFTGSGTAWTEEQRLSAPDAAQDDWFGFSVDIDGSTAIVGSHLDDDQGVNSGSAYVFRRASGTWSLEQKLLPEFGAYSDEFGYSVAVRGNLTLVGSRQDEVYLTNQGAAFLFERSGTTWNESARMLAPDAQDGDQLGTVVALSADRALIAAPLDDHLGNDSGSAYMFRLGPSAPMGPLCFGDGSGSSCPCGNESPSLGEGCLHSGGVGMRTSAAGTTSITANDLVMIVTQCPPNNTGLFYSGSLSLSPGNALFDGLQCAGGDVIRYQPVSQVTGIAADGGFVGQDPSGIYFVPGDTYYFQYWTRDAVLPSPCGTGANFSPAFAVTMQP